MASITPDYIDVLLISGNEDGEIKTLPAIKTNIDVFIKEDFSTRKTVTIDFKGVDNLQSLVICMPSGVGDFVFSEEDEFEQIQRFNEIRNCIKFTPDAKESFSFSYDTIPYQNLGGEFDYTFGIRKQPGVSVDYDVIVSVETDEPISFSEGGVQSANSIEYIGSLVGDKVFGIAFE